MSDPMTESCRPGVHSRFSTTVYRQSLIAPVVAATWLLSLAPSPGQEATKTTNFRDVYKQVVSSVVYVEAGEFVGRGIRTFGSGSGFILHAEGYIVTAAHVVESADAIRLAFHNGEQAEAMIVNMSQAQDLALLKVDKLPKGTTVAKLADAAKLQPAQPVFCIGAPHGLRFSVTAGVISGIREYQPSEYELHMPTRMIQTDVAINPGNSGGPIFNGKGEVVGVAVQRWEAENIGFAIPTDLIHQHLIDEAIPFAGVFYRRLSKEATAALNYPPGEAILIERVQIDSLAYKAGLRGGTVAVKIGETSVVLGGDLIYKIGGRSLADISAVRKYMHGLKKDDPVTCTIWRQGQFHKVAASFDMLAPVPPLESSSKPKSEQPSKERAASHDSP